MPPIRQLQLMPDPAPQPMQEPAPASFQSMDQQEQTVKLEQEPEVAPPPSKKRKGGVVTVGESRAYVPSATEQAMLNLQQQNANLLSALSELQRRNAELTAARSELQRRDSMQEPSSQAGGGEQQQAQLAAENVALSADNERLRARVQQLQDQNAELGAKTEEMQSDDGLDRTSNAELNQVILGLRAELKATRDSAIQNAGLVPQLRSEIEQQRQKIDDAKLAASVSERKIKEAQTRLDEARGRVVDDLNKQLADAKQDAEGLGRELAKALETAQQNSQAASRAIETNKDLEAQLRRLREDKRALQEEKGGEIAQLTRDNEKLTRDVASLNGQLTRLKSAQQLAPKQEELARIQAELDASRTSEADLKRQLATAKANEYKNFLEIFQRSPDPSQDEWVQSFKALQKQWEQKRIQELDNLKGLLEDQFRKVLAVTPSGGADGDDGGGGGRRGDGGDGGGRRGGGGGGEKKDLEPKDWDWLINRIREFVEKEKACRSRADDAKRAIEELQGEKRRLEAELAVELARIQQLENALALANGQNGILKGNAEAEVARLRMQLTNAEQDRVRDNANLERQAERLRTELKLSQERAQALDTRQRQLEAALQESKRRPQPPGANAMDESKELTAQLREAQRAAKACTPLDAEDVAFLVQMDMLVYLGILDPPAPEDRFSPAMNVEKDVTIRNWPMFLLSMRQWLVNDLLPNVNDRWVSIMSLMITGEPGEGKRSVGSGTDPQKLRLFAEMCNDRLWSRALSELMGHTFLPALPLLPQAWLEFTTSDDARLRRAIELCLELFESWTIPGPDGLVRWPTLGPGPEDAKAVEIFERVRFLYEEALISLINGTDETFRQSPFQFDYTAIHYGLKPQAGLLMHVTAATAPGKDKQYFSGRPKWSLRPRR